MDFTADLANLILQTRLLGNSVRSYLLCLLTILVGWAAVWLIRHWVLRWIHRLTRHNRTPFHDFLAENIVRLGMPALYAWIAYMALSDLHLKPSLAKLLEVGITVLIAVQAVRFLLRLARAQVNRLIYRRADSPLNVEEEKKSARGLLLVIQVVVWMLVIVVVLDNLGIRVSTFVAGLGITGIAVALAAQAVLGDLFSYFVIYFDRPFQVGHSIKVGNFQGEVESIGIKTTRLRSVTGEQIVMSNKYLTDNQVHNFRVMSRRRALLLFEVDSATPEADLRAIPEVLKELVSASPDATFDRAHFKEFGELGLRFEAVFFVETSNYHRYMDVVQEVNLGLKAALEKRGVSFASPSRTVRLIQS
jgi:small-conductance mechanosensitive channel